jgi:hypothetical protein
MVFPFMTLYLQGAMRQTLNRVAANSGMAIGSMLGGLFMRASHSLPDQDTLNRA